MLDRIGLHHFRSYSEATFKLSPSVTIINGPNGSGKTNLLEAIHVLCRGNSFRGSDSDMLQFDAPWWRVDGIYGDAERSVLFDASKQSGRKQFVINETKRLRLSPALKIPVVLFEPNDLRLLHGAPNRRRDYIDAFIAQLEPSYGTYVSRFERALKQRNNLLKNDHVSPDELFVWDVSLSELGAHIVTRRKWYCELLNQHITSVYRSISQTNDTIRLAYSYYDNLHNQVEIQQRFMTELHANYKKDSVLGYTGVGPHRHDIDILLNDSPALATASRGETRSIILSLKLIEIEQLIETSLQMPLLLLDDVFSELDVNRREALVKRSSGVQTIITTTNADTLTAHFKGERTIITTNHS